KRRKSGLIHRVEIRAKERISILTDPEGNARESSMLLPPSSCMSKIFVGKINPLKLARWKSCIFEGR
ncbi:MAG: hypothetical protein CW346_17565, partial [Bacillaceae bacterium]|nr:hypothetical protein [Bacillaceae bacterium]